MGTGGWPQSERSERSERSKKLGTSSRRGYPKPLAALITSPVPHLVCHHQLGRPPVIPNLHHALAGLRGEQRVHPAAAAAAGALVGRCKRVPAAAASGAFWASRNASRHLALPCRSV